MPLPIERKILCNGKGERVGNPRWVSCAIRINNFQNFFKVVEICSAGRKDFFDTLKDAARNTKFRAARCIPFRTFRCVGQSFFKI